MTNSVNTAAGAGAESVFFSVLVATYNQAGYLKDTLDTVARQTFTDYELIVVDDGSTDETPSVLSDWVTSFEAASTNRVAVTRIDNSGQSAAMEHGFGLCHGRYVALLDSDDRWEPEKLQRAHEAAVADPEAGMIVHPLFVIDAAGGRTGDTRPLRAKLSEGDLREQVRRTGRQIAPATSGIVLRSDIFQQLIPMPTRKFRSAADSFLTLGASLLAPVRAVHEPLGEYRMHGDSQYLRRTISAEGLRSTVAMQRAISGHFGIEDAMEKNAYFARHAFALAVFEGSAVERWRRYRILLRATMHDPSYSVRDQILFCTYWTICLFSPASLFGRLWRYFQMRHTGINRIRESAT